MMGDFDAIIIGAGQAGSSLAGRLTDAGMTVALVVEHSADLHAATEQVFAGCLRRRRR